MAPVYFILDLKDDPDSIAAYVKWHAAGAVPAGVTNSIRAAGIEQLEIYLAGNRLMMVLTPTERYDPIQKAAADAENADVQAWEVLMWEFQQALPFAKHGEKWLPMTRIYSLSEQP